MKKKVEKEKEDNAELNESLAKLEMELNKYQTNLKVMIDMGWRENIN